MRRLLLSEFIAGLPLGKPQLLRQCSSASDAERGPGNRGTRHRQAFALRRHALQTMIFDNKVRMADDPQGDVRRILLR